MTPDPAARYVNCVPLVPLQAAAGTFSDPHAIPDESDWEWVELDTARSLQPGMFVAQVVGKSMEPRIPDGVSPGPTTRDSRDRPRSRNGRGAIRRVQPSRVECLARSPRPKGWRRSRPCRCVPTRGG